MTAMDAQLENCVPINTISILEWQSGQELTTPWTFAVNGKGDVANFLQNAGLVGGQDANGDGSIDIRGVAMAWDVTLHLNDQNGAVVAEVYRASWTMSLDNITVQPVAMMRKLTRSVGAQMLLTLETYKIDDTRLLAPLYAFYGSLLGGVDTSGQVALPPSFNFAIHVNDIQF